MKNGWPIVRAGDVLQLQRRWLKLDPLKEYVEVGVRSYGQGIFHKQPVSGASLGDKRVLRICPGDLVFMNVFAWEGAVGVAGPGEDGKIGSHRFATYTPVNGSVDPRFLQLYFQTEPGRELLGRVSPGSAGRNRTMNLARFADELLPVPPIEEQQRIVARIEALAAKIAHACALRDESLNTLIQAARKSVFPEANGNKVGDYAKLQSGYAFKSEWFSDEGIRLVRNANIGHGTVDWRQVARIPRERRSEFKKFELSEGDILITLDRPIISSGIKVARVGPDDLPSLLLQRVARVQFTSEAVDPDYLFAWLQSPRFAAAIDPGRSNGVPHISPKDVERAPFSAPPKAEQRRVVAYLNAVVSKAETLKLLQQQSAAELDALLPSILDKAFQGGL